MIATLTLKCLVASLACGPMQGESPARQEGLDRFSQARTTRPVVLCVLRDGLAGSWASPAPAKSESLQSLADSLGMDVATYPTVQALVPKTMRVFNAPDERTSPIAGFRPEQSLKALLATFDDGMWKALGNEAGIGLSDMRSDLQRALFVSLVTPGETLAIKTSGPNPVQSQIGGGSDSRRLRLAQSVRIYYPVQHDGRESMVSTPGFGRYKDARPFRPPNAIPQDAKPYADVPNAPKPSQLNLATPTLTSTLGPNALQSVHTVKDLVSLVRKASGLELYVDVRYGTLQVALRADGPATLADLMRALLAGLTATVRRVGPAYVITDDLLGVGARQEQWARFLKSGESGLQQADAIVQNVFSETNVYPNESSLSLSKEQTMMATQGTPPPVGFTGVDTTFGQLTPPQQAEMQLAAKSIPSLAADLSSDTRISLAVRPDLQILVSGLDAPVSVEGAASFLEGYVQRREAARRRAAATAPRRRSPPRSPSSATGRRSFPPPSCRRRRSGSRHSGRSGSRPFGSRCRSRTSSRARRAPSRSRARCARSRQRG